MNIETRIANRSKSIFAAFGTIVNDFYLEAGIYFVGGFNASLVAWDIYTDLLAEGQPLPYAITIAIITFVAVEGLAVYLVGAAAKTNNGLLWFFSVLFAMFFTFAHYREMTTNAGIISQYITLAIPFFVVVGYWARTVKVDAENNQTQAAQQNDNEVARQERLEDEEREFDQRLKLIEIEKGHELKLARIEAKKSVPQLSQDRTLKTLKPEILAELGREKPNLSQLASRLEVGRSTLYRHIGTLVGTGEVIKNGNGYELNGTVAK